MSENRREKSRRNFSYYMRVLDDATGKIVGHLSDISTGGFKVDSKYDIPLNVDLRLRIDQTGEISNKNFLVFTARARWSQRDRSNPATYNVGFKILEMSPEDYGIFVKMFNTYGTQESAAEDIDSLDYLFG
jgi:hypothetical protein